MTSRLVRGDVFVEVPARSCALLAPCLRQLRRELCRDGEPDPDALEVLDAIEIVGRAYRQRHAQSVQAQRPVDLEFVAWVGVADVAARLGVSSRAVRARCERGSLPAAKRGGVWLIDPCVLDG